MTCVGLPLAQRFNAGPLLSSLPLFQGGDVRELDFRFYLGDKKIGAPFHGLRAFFTTPQLSFTDKVANSLALGTSPVVRCVLGGARSLARLREARRADACRAAGVDMQRDAPIKHFETVPPAHAVLLVFCAQVPV